jgi:hypothetical protein
VPAYNTPMKPGSREVLLMAIAKARTCIKEVEHGHSFADIAHREGNEIEVSQMSTKRKLVEVDAYMRTSSATTWAAKINGGPFAHPGHNTRPAPLSTR